MGTAVTIGSIPERTTPTQGHLDKAFIRMATRALYYLAEAGDVTVADDSGVCVIPAEKAENVLTMLLKILDGESRMRDLIFSNAPISEQKKVFRKRYE